MRQIVVRIDIVSIGIFIIGFALAWIGGSVIRRRRRMTVDVIDAVGKAMPDALKTAQGGAPMVRRHPPTGRPSLHDVAVNPVEDVMVRDRRPDDAVWASTRGYAVHVGPSRPGPVPPGMFEVSMWRDFELVVVAEFSPFLLAQIRDRINVLLLHDPILGLGVSEAPWFPSDSATVKVQWVYCEYCSLEFAGVEELRVHQESQHPPIPAAAEVPPAPLV